MKSHAASTAFVILGLAALLLAAGHRPQHLHVNTRPELTAAHRMSYGNLPDTSNSLFTGSGKCSGCHAKDPNNFASIAGQTFPPSPMPDGWDVNVTDDWRSTLMANSAKDPFWRAKVAHEVTTNPGHQLELEDKCTSCHAPLGHFAAHHDGQEFYTMAEMVLDSLALDGVSCNACHQQDPELTGTTFSGELHFSEDTLYGPYGGSEDDPPLYALPMNTYVGYEPVYADYITKSEACAGCHSLVTQTADLEGNPTGEDYIEQATYHEWLNSRYAPPTWEGSPNALRQECQGCHMPSINDPVIISSGYVFLEPRSPYGLHYLVGANAAMLRLMRDNIDNLGLSATAAQFDSTISRTLDLLQQHSLDMQVDAEYDPEAALVTADIALTNLTGHKFPSGYPARRFWLEVVLKHPETGVRVWQSGALTPDGLSIEGADEAGLTSFEAHHTVIDSEEQVQIYELVIADVTGAPTNLLERAAYTLKDNRLPPLGFTTNHPVYDTTAVVGAEVEADMLFGDFNRTEDGAEGSGADRIRYEMALPADWPEGLTPEVEVKVWYQAMPPRWVASMFETEAPAIADFEGLYWDYAAPDLVTAQVTTPINLAGGTELDGDASSFAVFPNPVASGEALTLKGWSSEEPVACTWFDAQGKVLKRQLVAGHQPTLMVPSDWPPGLYHLQLGRGPALRLIVR